MTGAAAACCLERFTRKVPAPGQPHPGADGGRGLPMPPDNGVPPTLSPHRPLFAEDSTCLGRWESGPLPPQFVPSSHFSPLSYPVSFVPLTCYAHSPKTFFLNLAEIQLTYVKFIHWKCAAGWVSLFASPVSLLALTLWVSHEGSAHQAGTLLPRSPARPQHLQQCLPVTQRHCVSPS